jgi:hypothetical protein
MNPEKIQAKLLEAQQRLSSAESDDRYFTNDINYHDQLASEIRKKRQRARSKKDRAVEAIARYKALLASKSA